MVGEEVKVRGPTEKQSFFRSEWKTLHEIWKYRLVIFSMIRRNLVGRYKNTTLGIAWNLLMPILTIFVYCLVFTTIRAKAVDAYWLYVCSGMLPMLFISGCMSGRSIINNRRYLKKMHIPMEVVVIADVLTSMITFLVSYTLCIIIALIYDYNTPGTYVSMEALATLPVFLIFMTILGLGLAKVTSTIMVMVRDLGLALSVLSRLIIWITPTIFMLEEADNLLLTLALLNPFTYYIDIFHNTLYYDYFSSWELIVTFITALIIWRAGTYVFDRYKHRFVEVL